MSKRCHIDIESRSCCDLRRSGAFVYCEHASTEITVVCWAVDNGPVQTWKMRDDPRDLAPLQQLLDDPGVTLVAHNAAEFECIMLGGDPGRRLGLSSPMALSRWCCTAARAAAVGLPRSLDAAAAALGLDHRKDAVGGRLMLQMAKPKPRTGLAGVPPQWFDDPERVDRLAAYCAQDVIVERELDRILPMLSSPERTTWEVTCKMNRRGVPIDAALVVRLALMVQDAEARLNIKLAAATGGAVQRVTDHGALTRWLDSRGVPVDDGVGKAAIRAMIEGMDAADAVAPNPERDLIREVLVLRQEGGKSSASKYRALLQRMSSDGRIRGSLTYCGASATGRWSSRGINLQNLTRGGSLKDVDGAIADVLGDTPLDLIEFIHGPGLIVASELLRPVFTAGGDNA